MRILHFSDVHVQESVTAMPLTELLGKRILAAGNLFLKRGRLFRDAQEKLAALIAFAERERVDVALYTGDFTAVGSEAEYAEARRAFEPLTRCAAGLCAVPGNHDLYLEDTVEHARFERHFGEFARSDWPDSAVDGVFPFVRLFGESLAVIGVNSAKPNPNPFLSTGCIPDGQLAALEKLLEDPRLTGRWIVAMTHYGVIRKDGTPDTPHHGLENVAAFMRICNRPGVVVVHGHIHHRFHHAPSEQRPWLFCSGSATQREREGFWLYELSGTHLRATPGAWTGSEYVLESAGALELGARS
jgi:3',5'-cyclic AMP phosphodiesterase CpdA